MSLLDNIVVVFHRPQDPINIAGTVRVMKNMGLADLRLVQPAPYDPWRIEGIAHGTRDVVDRIKAVKTGKKGFHGDVPLDDIIIERAEVV